MDPWGELVGSFSFLIGVGFYLFNRSGEVLYIYMMVFIIFLRGIDLRHFAYLEIANGVIVGQLGWTGQEVGSCSESEDSKLVGFSRNGWAAKFSRVTMRFLDDRARSVDLVCLFILVEVLS